MKNSRNKFVCFCVLLIAGVLFADTISAARGGANGKRASKSKTKNSKKKVVVTSTSTATESASEDRAASSTRVRGETTTATTPVNEDEAAEVLAGQIMTYVYGVCNGDVEYEKCFKNANDPETFIRKDTSAWNLYNAASTDMIKIKAKNIITTKVRSYFSDACASAGGKVKGTECEIDICYYAKAGGKSNSKHNKCAGFKIGKTVTCSYTQFGLSDQDMEYKEEMTGEQLGAIIQSGMGILTGVMETGVAIGNAVSASKELKKKNIIKGKKCAFVYTHGAEHIDQNSSYCDEVVSNMCEKDGKKSCNEGTGDSKDDIVDSQGRHYAGKKTTDAKDKGKKNGGNTNIQSCSSLNASKWAAKEDKNKNLYNKCYVEIDEWTDLAIQEKEAELYKKFTDFASLENQDKFNAMKAGLLSQSMNSKMLSTFNPEDVDCGKIVGAPHYETVNNSQVYKNCYDLGLVEGSAVQPGSCRQNNYGSCVCLSTENKCKKATWKNNSYYVAGEIDSSLFEYKEKVDENGHGTGEHEDKSALDKQFDSYQKTFNGIKLNNLSSAVETYNSMQKSVTENKNKITQLEQKKSEGISTAIATGSATLLQQGGALATSIVAANSNTGTMTGSCYIGDPEKGGTYFLGEGAVKKLTWNSF